jgi:nickel-dependent lactate racemase
MTTQEILAKAVESALGNGDFDSNSNSNSGDEKRFNSMEKSIATLSTQISKLAEIVVVKKEETIEDKFEKLSKSLTESIEKMGKKEEETIELPKTVEDLQKMIAESIEKATSTDGVDGEGKDALGKTIEDLKNGKAVDLDLSSIELNDKAGNELSKTTREDRKKLDAFFSEAIGE